MMKPHGLVSRRLLEQHRVHRVATEVERNNVRNGKIHNIHRSTTTTSNSLVVRFLHPPTVRAEHIRDIGRKRDGRFRVALLKFPGDDL